MATNFPTSLDNLTNPAGSDPVNNPSHASQHANLNDAIEKLEEKVGVNNSAVTTSLDYRVKQLETNPVASYTDEEARNAIGTALTGSGGITVTPNNVANTITVSTDSTIATKTYVDTAVSNLGSTAASTYVPVSEVGQADGIATLDATGQVPFSQLGNLVASAPATLDTLNELATALGNDANFATTTATSIGNKVSKAGGDIIQSSLASTIPLVLKGAASQTANLQEWHDSAGNLLGRITSTGVTSFYGGSNIFPGDVRAGTSSYLTAALSVASRISTESGLVVRGFASQSADYFQIQTSSGTVLAQLNSSNQFNVNYGSIYTPYGIRAGSNNHIGLASVSAFSINAGYLALGVKGFTGQTANLTEWQNSSGTVLAAVEPSGSFYGSSITAYGVLTSNSSFRVNNAAAGTVAAIVKGAASQTANLQEWQRSNGTTDLLVTNFGAIVSGGGTTIASNPTINAYGAAMVISSGVNTYPMLILKGAASQSANIQEWQNSAGTVLSKVDASGAMFTVTPADSTNTTQVATTAYVKSNINNLINSAPGTLDTLNELATALGNDANFSTTITNSLASKAPLASPTLTGTPLAPTATTGTNTTQIATTAFVKTAIDTSVQPGAVYQTSAPSSPAVGQIWIDSDEDVTTFDSNIIRRKAITATAGQTVFTADLPFIDGFEQIFMNGLLLVKTTDYATSGGNTVTLTSAAAASDVIEIVSVTGANSVNTYTQSEVDALLAANTSVAPLSISANTTLVAKKRYFVTSASALTLTLPASPALNDEIQIVDASGNASTYNITVARNANKINGGLNNLIIDTNGGWYTLLYTGSTYGWKVG